LRIHLLHSIRTLPFFVYYAMVSGAMNVGVNCNKCLNRDECRFYPDDYNPLSGKLSSTIIGAVELEIILHDSVAKRLLFGDCKKLKETNSDRHHVVIDLGGLTVTEVIEKVRGPGIETVNIPVSDAQSTKVIPEIYVRLNDATIRGGESGDS